MRAKGSPYPEPSALTITLEECQELVDRYAGTGRPEETRDGRWKGTEVCRADMIIGYVVGMDGGKTYTNWFKIHYGKKGTHLVPRRPGVKNEA